jgi:hydroxymethylglutaryl-CoA lyase
MIDDSQSTKRDVVIVEVGPRDGLQNEPRTVPTPAKIAFIEALADAGLRVVEATSFVSPTAVPQLADADEVMRSIRRRPGVRYPVLVPNERGLDRALAAGVDAIALFTAATDAFCQANIRCSIAESFARFQPVVDRALTGGLWVRGYVSVAFDCPYSGRVAPEDAVKVAARLFDLGCAEVSLADTIGTALPEDVARLLDVAATQLPVERTALHFHDTHGHAVDNVACAFERGVRIFDAAAGGLGGCPFAPGAPGNVATESVLAYFADRGVETGVSLTAVREAMTALRSAMTGDPRVEDEP